MQLMKLCDLPEFFSLNDLGCGYGALLAYLAKRHSEAKIDYLGIDLSPAMVRRAKRLWRNQKDAKFVVGQQARGLPITPSPAAFSMSNWNNPSPGGSTSSR